MGCTLYACINFQGYTLAVVSRPCEQAVRLRVTRVNFTTINRCHTLPFILLQTLPTENMMKLLFFYYPLFSLVFSFQLTPKKGYNIYVFLGNKE